MLDDMVLFTQYRDVFETLGTKVVVPQVMHIQSVRRGAPFAVP